MPLYEARRQAQSYGHEIGILLIDCINPFIPGDVGNASSYRFPVLYRSVGTVTIERLIGQADRSLAAAVIDAARDLERHGVRAITSDCGYMLYFQEQVARAVSVPVMLSSLLQLPFIDAFLPQGKEIGVICANAARFTPELLALARPPRERAIRIRGMEHTRAFAGPILHENGTLDSDAAEAEVVAVASALVAEHPEIGAILLECSNLPPYAHAVQRATRRPVFDFLTMIDHMQAACHRRPYAGLY